MTVWTRTQRFLYQFFRDHCLAAHRLLRVWVASLVILGFLAAPVQVAAASSSAAAWPALDVPLVTQQELV
ncbi:MAG: hypothetical protein WDZ49_10850, partial [Litorilinea sp.]